MNNIAAAAIGVLTGIAAVNAPAIDADADEDQTLLGQPGFYGRLDLAEDSPRPEIHFSEPHLVEPVPAFEESIYLRVRPGELNEWDLYCYHYEACARYVYFVNDDWYLQVYVPYYRYRRDRDDPNYDEGDVDSARRARDSRDEHRNDEPWGDPGEVN